LTLAAHHYGSEATNTMLKSLDREIKYMTDKVKEMEAERPKFANVISPQSSKKKKACTESV
jgi:ubiquitin conjugation factor E4 B